MKELLFVVDMVNGFVKEGSMHDASIMKIVDVIKKECETHEDRLFIADTHEKRPWNLKAFRLIASKAHRKLRSLMN